ncbi:RluA family pseudouridine synthase [Shewanella sp. CG12_big_fil_rev_8_21_14_0_65_47_15]|uniref:RluA family pseudouridine synthase n=1 Tax=Shewanella sp. CG12_big_fil_rev_8_21_14_0_65_47_15 TaxID=1975537 RepID=UPI000CB8324A|nr:RluA family pseudouridine synthase [Shewanella sp. CG12_big_fil_rev_8_21_14_0_65_47_15]PIW60737.1 MAG: RNA pseudouridine synthase [Shewanella sp. CG12_big_fil_rev_8_21_14_0_65_47_15]
MQIFDYQPPAVPWLDIRYKDRDLVIINKPSGLLSNPGIAAHTYDCALTRLQTLYPETILVHRLDCATSGIMVFARNKKAESHLKTQFQDRQSKKIYIAEVMGHVPQQQGMIDLAIAPDTEHPPYQKTLQAGETGGKSAITHYRVLERRQNSTLVELSPETGRTHQLRVHMLALGYPILGDEFYGNAEVIGAKPRLCLHAQGLCFSHPYSGKAMCFYSKHPFSE